MSDHANCDSFPCPHYGPTLNTDQRIAAGLAVSDPDTSIPEAVRPLSASELDEVRRRDANAAKHPRTWAIEDRRRLLATLDAERRTPDPDALREAATALLAAWERGDNLAAGYMRDIRSALAAPAAPRPERPMPIEQAEGYRP